MKSKVLNKLFDGKNVIIEIDENNNIFFEVESVAMAIGYITIAKGKEYVHKSRMNKTLKNAEIIARLPGGPKFRFLIFHS